RITDVRQQPKVQHIPGARESPTAHRIPKVRQIPKVHQIPSARQIPRTHRIPKVRQIPKVHQIPSARQIPRTHRIPKVRQIPKVHQIPSARQIPRTHRIPKVRQIPTARQIPKVHQIPPARRAVAVLVLLAGGLPAGVSTARPASAHAELVPADPPDGSRLASPPGRVTLTFSESVSLGVGFVRVVDQSGHEVDAGPAEHPAGAGEAVAVRLRPRLPNGGYLVSYQVVSADSHPISRAGAVTVGDRPLP